MKPSETRTLRCAGCRTATQKDGNKYFPFCCERCQLVDLGRWLNEEYRVPDPSTPVPDGTSSRDDD